MFDAIEITTILLTDHHPPNRSRLEAVDDVSDALGQTEESPLVQELLLLPEVGGVVVHVLPVLLGEDPVEEDDHVEVVHQDDQLPVALLLLGQPHPLLSQVVHLLLHEVHDLDEAPLQLVGQGFQAPHPALPQDALESLGDAVLLTASAQSLPLLLAELGLLHALLVALHLQPVVLAEVVGLLDLLQLLHDLGVEDGVVEDVALELVLDLVHEVEDELLEAHAHQVPHEGELYLVLALGRQRHLLGLLHHLLQEVYLELLVHDLTQDGDEGLVGLVVFEVEAVDGVGVHVGAPVHYVHVELLRYYVLCVLRAQVPPDGPPDRRLRPAGLVLPHQWVGEELLPLDAFALVVGEHAPQEVDEFGGDLEGAGLVEGQLLLDVLLLVDDLLVGDGLVEHPVEGDAQGVDVALAGVLLLEADLGGGGHEGADVLLVELLPLLEQLPAQPEVGHLQHPLVHQDVLGLDVPVDDVQPHQVLEGVEDLLEVVQHVVLTSYLLLLVQALDVAVQVLVPAELQDQVDPPVLDVPDHVLDLDDVGVVPQLYQRLDLLPRGRHPVAYLVDLLDAAGDADDLEGQLVQPSRGLLVVADVDPPVGALPQHEVRLLRVVVLEGRTLQGPEVPPVWAPVYCLKLHALLLLLLLALGRHHLAHSQALLQDLVHLDLRLSELLPQHSLPINSLDSNTIDNQAMSFISSQESDSRQSRSPYRVNVISTMKRLKRLGSKEFSEFSGMSSLRDSGADSVPPPPKQIYKCYKCFGTGNGVSKCSECNGTHFISEGHPVVGMMEALLQKKIPHLLRRADEASPSELKPSNRLEVRMADPIKEESVSYNEEAVYCSHCRAECEGGQWDCPQCDYHICQECQSKQVFTHRHRNQPQNNNFMTAPKPLRLRKISEQLSALQVSHLWGSSQQIHCSHCNGVIEECFEICQTCRQAGQDYKLCPDCALVKDEKHSSAHSFEVRTVNHPSRITDSVEASEDNKLSPEPQLGAKNNSLVMIPIDMYESMGDMSVTAPIINDSQKLNLETSLAFQESVKDEDFPQLRKQSTSKGEPVVHYDSENESSQIKNTHQLAKPEDKYLDPPLSEILSAASSHLVLDSDESKESKSRPKKEAQPENPQYLFTNYQCDICGVSPIVNKRYHCERCSDFDICEGCFKDRRDEHKHQSFEEINGQEIMAKQKQSIADLKEAKLSEMCNKQIRNSMTLMLSHRSSRK